MTRILSKITHLNEAERKYFHDKASELGYGSFVEFAKTAMEKEIASNNFAVSNLNKIADLAGNLKQVFDIQEEETDLTPEEEQANLAAELIYDLAVHTDIMKNSPENQVWMDDPAYLEGEKPRYVYRHALQKGFDISKYI